jgi:hypothetical protein
MDLEAHFQNLASLNINPDKIGNELYAKAGSVAKNSKKYVTL